MQTIIHMASEPEAILSGKLLLQGVVTVVSILGSAYLAYRYGVKKLRKETPVLVERDIYNRKLDSLQACWKLLAYTTDTENKHAFLTFTETKAKERSYYGSRANGEAFLQALAEYFYGSGLGIYLPTSIKEPLFAYRSMVFGFLLATKESGGDKFAIDNPEMVAKLKQLHQDMVRLLRREVMELPNSVGMKK